MRSKAQITKELKELDDKRHQLIEFVYDDPLVVGKTKEVEVKKQELENVIAKARDKISAQDRELLTKIDVLEREFKEVEKAKAIVVPKKVQDFIIEICCGVDFGYRGWVVKWVSPKERFAILTNPGCTYSSGMDRPYGATYHYLFNITKVNDKGHNDLTYDHCTVFKKEGRLDKETKRKWISYALKEESNEQTRHTKIR